MFIVETFREHTILILPFANVHNIYQIELIACAWISMNTYNFTTTFQNAAYILDERRNMGARIGVVDAGATWSKSKWNEK